VGVWESSRFIGVVVIWPYVNPDVEPRVGMLKEIVAAISVG
jgi:predicted small integral membrane protein